MKSGKHRRRNAVKMVPRGRRMPKCMECDEVIPSSFKKPMASDYCASCASKAWRHVWARGMPMSKLPANLRGEA